MFSQRAIQEFKEAFGIMDADKVGNKKILFITLSRWNLWWLLSQSLMLKTFRLYMKSSNLTNISKGLKLTDIRWILDKINIITPSCLKHEKESK